jgi:flagellar M-ring protein FliF
MDLLKKLGPLKLMLLSGLALFLLAAILFLTMQMSSPVLSPLYSDLSSEDSMAISAKLYSMNIKFNVSPDGKEINVPFDKVSALRMIFAEQGLPTSARMVGYEIFDRSEGMGSSQFIYNVNLVRALEGELARTIGTLKPVEHARVHLVMPRKEMFSKTGAEPTASVVLRLRANQDLSKDEISAVAHLVSTAVPSLNVENVTIVDARGKPLKLGAEINDGGQINASTSEYQSQFEAKIRREVEDLLEKSVGIGKVKVNAAVDIDFDREVINSEIFDAENPVIRSKKTVEEQETSTSPSNVVGVATNLPQARNNQNNANSNNKTRTDETINYEVSKTITNKIVENGHVRKLSLAILVDGSYEENKETGELIYKERTADEMEKLKVLVASAVGLDPKRGDTLELINMRFSNEFVLPPEREDNYNWLKDQMQKIVQTIVIGIVVLLALLLIVRPVILKAINDNTADISDEFGDIARAAANMGIRDDLAFEGAGRTESESKVSEEFINLAAGEDKGKATLLRQLNEIVDGHPEEAVAIIRNWMYQR